MWLRTTFPNRSIALDPQSKLKSLSGPLNTAKIRSKRVVSFPSFGRTNRKLPSNVTSM